MTNQKPEKWIKEFERLWDDFEEFPTTTNGRGLFKSFIRQLLQSAREEERKIIFKKEYCIGRKVAQRIMDRERAEERARAIQEIYEVEQRFINLNLQPSVVNKEAMSIWSASLQAWKLLKNQLTKSSITKGEE